MDCLTEINRNHPIRSLSVTEINRHPYRGGRFSVVFSVVLHD